MYSDPITMQFLYGEQCILYVLRQLKIGTTYQTLSLIGCSNFKYININICMSVKYTDIYLCNMIILKRHLFSHLLPGPMGVRPAQQCMYYRQTVTEPNSSPKNCSNPTIKNDPCPLQTFSNDGIIKKIANFELLPKPSNLLNRKCLKKLNV